MFLFFSIYFFLSYTFVLAGFFTGDIQEVFEEDNFNSRDKVIFSLFYAPILIVHVLISELIRRLK